MARESGQLTANWAGERVYTSAVEKALSEMLRELNPPDPLGQPSPLTRTSVLNLVVRSSGDLTDDAATPTLLQISERHPSRTIVITTDESAPEAGLDAHASARCQLGVGQRNRVCYEEIDLLVRGELARQLTSVVAPLLVPDLPVVLWWIGAPPASSEPLLAMTDHLIVDSGEYTPANLRELVSLMDATSPRLLVSDLAWAGLAAWREYVAQLFDTPDSRQFQSGVDAVRLRHAAGGGPGEWLLMLSWLATRLGWTDSGDGAAADDGRSIVTFARPGGTVTATVERCDAATGFEPGELVSVIVESGLDGHRATFEVTRDCGAGCATQRAVIDNTTATSRVVPLARSSTAESLGQELTRASGSPAYSASVRLAAVIASRLG